MKVKTKYVGDTKNRTRVTFYLPHESMHQLDELLASTNLRGRSNVVALAIARWHSTEPLVEAMKRTA